LLVGIAQSQGPTSLEGLTIRFENADTTRVAVSDDLRARVEEYISQQGLRTRYKQASEVAPLHVELQDLYLSDPDLPSSSGAITGVLQRKGYRHTVYVEIPPWAVSLGLLRSEDYGPTDRGRALLLLSPSTMVDAFRQYNPAFNPFLLSPEERVFLLYSLFDSDGDLLWYLLPRMRHSRAEMTRSQVGDLVVESLEKLRDGRLARPSSGQEQAQRRKLQEVLNSARDQTGSGMGPRESIATLRTEPLVDCGLLERTSRHVYSYRLTPAGDHFAKLLGEAESVGQFLMGSFSEGVAQAHWRCCVR
jgi:hypothetical protein